MRLLLLLKEKRNRVRTSVTESAESGMAISASVSASSLRLLHVLLDLARARTRTSSGASMSVRSDSREAALQEEPRVCGSWPGVGGKELPCRCASVLVATDCCRGGVASASEVFVQ